MPNKTDAVEIISAIIAFGALLVSCFSIYISTKLNRDNQRKQDQLDRKNREEQARLADKQEALERQLATEQASLEQQLAAEQAKLEKQLKNQDLNFAKKMLVINLWDKMANIAKIQKDDQGAYNEEDIFEALNVLELVAVSWQENIIDHDMVRKVFKISYKHRVDEIRSIQETLPSLLKNGRELLTARPVIEDVESSIK